MDTIHRKFDLFDDTPEEPMENKTTSVMPSPAVPPLPPSGPLTSKEMQFQEFCLREMGAGMPPPPPPSSRFIRPRI